MDSDAPGSVSAQARHDAWLATTVEEALEPERPIIDPHHHIWLLNPKQPLVHKYMLDELSKDVAASGHNIVKTVYIQSNSAGWRRPNGPDHLRPLLEVEVMHGIAAMAESGLFGSTGVCAGIIGTVDLMAGAEKVEEALQKHMCASRNFRGVRYRAEHVDFGNATFREGVEILESLGLLYEVNGPETHPMDFQGVLGGIEDLARAFPNLTIVVDHCGGGAGPQSFEDAGKREEWESAIDSLSRCANVIMKVGGLQMPLNGFPIGPENRLVPVGSEELASLVVPYYEKVIRAFGPDRCMFESNFPVDKWGVSYGVLWNTFKRVATLLGLEEDQKGALFHDTAALIYGLSDDAEEGADDLATAE